MGLKSKIYLFIKYGCVGDQNAKEIIKNFVKKMKHEECKDVLFSEKSVRHEMERIQRKNHKLRK